MCVYNWRGRRFWQMIPSWLCDFVFLILETTTTSTHQVDVVLSISLNVCLYVCLLALSNVPSNIVKYKFFETLKWARTSIIEATYADHAATGVTCSLPKRTLVRAAWFWISCKIRIVLVGRPYKRIYSSPALKSHRLEHWYCADKELHCSVMYWELRNSDFL